MLLTSVAPCEVVSLVSMVIQHQDGKQFTVDSLLKYFNSSTNDKGNVYTVNCVIMGRGVRMEREKKRVGMQKRGRVVGSCEQTGSQRGER